MISARTGAILKSIVEQYIARATPVPSLSIAHVPEFKVSSATIRNEMVHLEKEGYIIRPHTSAGSIPSDKGYRYYVETLQEATLSSTEQRMISHLFHQVERELELWLSLAATLLAQLVQNAAVVTKPKSAHATFKHLELVSLQDYLGLLVLVLFGAKVRQQLVQFDHFVSQPELTAIANKLNATFAGLDRKKITAETADLSPFEQQVSEHIGRIMQAEDEKEYEEPFLDGLHFMLGQPEFAHGQQMLGLMELVEHHKLVRTIVPGELEGHRAQVIIGKENKAEAFHNYSVVIKRYGIGEKVVGTVGVVGPTRMDYSHAISTVSYLASVLSQLMTGLYGEDTGPAPSRN